MFAQKNCSTIRAPSIRAGLHRKRTGFTMPCKFVSSLSAFHLLVPDLQLMIHWQLARKLHAKLASAKQTLG